MRMKARRFIALVGSVMVLAGFVSALAHHNTSARYDEDNPVTLQGTVVRLRMVNPHMQLEFEVTDANGNSVHWVAESGPPSNKFRAGWRTDTLKPGDPITITGGPAVNGSPSMDMIKVVTPDGRELE